MTMEHSEDLSELAVRLAAFARRTLTRTGYNPGRRRSLSR